MTPVFATLNRKDHREIVVPGAPEQFEREPEGWEWVGIRRSLSGSPHVRFPLAFVIRKKDLEGIARGRRRASR